MDKAKYYDEYMMYISQNRCYNKKCASNIGGVCEDIRGIKNCESHKNGR